MLGIAHHRKQKKRHRIEYEDSPSDTAISSSPAFTTGPTAAIALPPQIAVPALIKRAEVFGTLRRPSARPSKSAKLMPIAL